MLFVQKLNTLTVLILLLSTTTSFSAYRCDLAPVDVKANTKRPDVVKSNAESAAGGDLCVGVMARFVEAVTLKEQISSCQDNAARQQALDAVAAELVMLNDRIAANLCGQQR